MIVEYSLMLAMVQKFRTPLGSITVAPCICSGLRPCHCALLFCVNFIGLCAAAFIYGNMATKVGFCVKRLVFRHICSSGRYVTHDGLCIYSIVFCGASWFLHLFPSWHIVEWVGNRTITTTGSLGGFQKLYC